MKDTRTPSPTNASGVQQVVVLGTPFLGTPRAFYTLQEGFCVDDEWYCMPNQEVVKRLSKNFEGSTS